MISPSEPRTISEYFSEGDTVVRLTMDPHPSGRMLATRTVVYGGIDREYPQISMRSRSTCLAIIKTPDGIPSIFGPQAVTTWLEQMPRSGVQSGPFAAFCSRFVDRATKEFLGLWKEEADQ